MIPFQPSQGFIDAVEAGKSAASIRRDFAPDVSERRVREIVKEMKTNKEVSEVPLSERLLAFIRNKKIPRTIEQLCDLTDNSPCKVRAALQELRDQHYAVNINQGGLVFLGEEAKCDSGEVRQAFKAPQNEWVRFGFVTDMHMCNVNHREDLTRILYDRFESEGITTVYDAGNWIDGEAPFNRTELVVPPGFENQLRYAVDHYPSGNGITSYFIAGDDHEGWYANRHGIDVGRRFQQTARDMGRTDLVYLGYMESDIVYQTDGGQCRVRITHPGGGSAYADTYMAQKLVEACDPLLRPQVWLYGHYHKSVYDQIQRVHTIGGGCLTDSSLFMRKKRLRSDVGGWIVELRLDETGRVSEFRPQWFPFPPRELNPAGYVPFGQTPNIRPNQLVNTNY